MSITDAFIPEMSPEQLNWRSLRDSFTAITRKYPPKGDRYAALGAFEADIETCLSLMQSLGVCEARTGKFAVRRDMHGPTEMVLATDFYLPVYHEPQAKNLIDRLMYTVDRHLRHGAGLKVVVHNDLSNFYTVPYANNPDVAAHPTRYRGELTQSFDVHRLKHIFELPIGELVDSPFFRGKAIRWAWESYQEVLRAQVTMEAMKHSLAGLSFINYEPDISSMLKKGI